MSQNHDGHLTQNLVESKWLMSNVSMVSLLFGFFLLKGVECASVLVGSSRGVLLVDSTRCAVVVPSEASVYSLDYHYARGQLYYCQDGAIVRRSLHFSSSTPSERVVRQQGLYANSVAVDWIHDVMYWTVGVKTLVGIYKADLDNATPTLIISGAHINLQNYLGNPSNLTYLYKISVDPFAENIFVLAKEESSDKSWHSVIKAGLNGLNAVRIVHTDLKAAETMSLDVQSRRIYASGIQPGQNFGFVVSTNYEGRDVKRHFRKENVLVYPIHVAGTSLYSVIRDVSSMSGPSSLYCNSTSQPSAYGQLIHIFDLKGVAAAAQLSRGEFQFAQCRGLHGCSYQCVVLPSAGATCVCPRGEQLATDGKTCQDDDGVQLLVSDDGGISSILVGKGSSSKSVKTLLVSKSASAIAYDYFLNYLFFFSPLDSAIYRTSMVEEGEVKKVVVGEEVTALAVDRWNDALYWGDGSDLIKSNLAGGLMEVIISEQSNASRFLDIQVASFKNYLFMVVVKNKVGQLMRSTLSGKSMVLRQNKDYVQTIGVDTKNEEIYVLVLKHSKAYISLVDYDFNESTNYEISGDHKQVEGVFGLSFWLYDGKLFLASRSKDNRTSLFEAALGENLHFKELEVDLQGQVDLRVVSAWGQFSPEDQQCVVRGCSHICRGSAPGVPGVHCACPGLAFVLAPDKTTCIINPEATRARSPVVFPTSAPPPTISADRSTLHYVLLGIALLMIALTTAFCLWRKYGLRVGRHRFEYQRNWWRSSAAPPPRAVVVDARLRPVGQRKERSRAGP